LENNIAIVEAQIIVETAKVCSQLRWLVFAFLGVLVAVGIGAGMGITFGNGGASVRLLKLQERITKEMPLLQFGPSQIEVLNWLANEDPTMIDFKTTPFVTIMERYASIVTLYYSLNGPQWEDQGGFLSKESVCEWNKIKGVRR
jgi:hypothetical protein